MNLWKMHAQTHTQTEQKRDGLNKAKGVCTDGSIQILTFKRHHVPTYVCNTDKKNNKGRWPLRPSEHPNLLCSLRNSDSSEPDVNSSTTVGKNADFTLFYAEKDII